MRIIKRLAVLSWMILLVSFPAYADLGGNPSFWEEGEGQPQQAKKWDVVPGANGLSFRRVLPFEFIYHETAPSALPPASDVVVIGCRGEREPVTFAVYSERDLPAVTLNIADLTSPEGRVLPARSLETRVVKVWDQWHGGWVMRKKMTVEEADKAFAPFLRPTPEVLLTDDLMDPQESWQEVDLPNGKKTLVYVAPKFPATLRTALQAKQLKQFWVTVEIPADQPAGSYRGQIQLLSQGQEVARLPIQIFVLPTTLEPPGVLTGMYFRSVLNHVKYFSVDETYFQRELEFLKKRGIECITVYGKNPFETMEKIFSLAKQAGLKGPVMQMNTDHEAEEMKRFVELAKRYGQKPYFFGVDEPGSQRSLERHIEISKRVQKAGGKIATAIRSDTCQWLDKKLPLDWANCSQYYIPATEPKETYDGEPEKRVVGGKDIGRDIVTQYWQCWDEKPLGNRIRAGFYMYRSGLDGFMPFCTYAFQVGLPYHKDWRTGSPPTSRQRSWMKVFGFYYPSQDGPVPTLQGEALAEGIDDLRYVRTVEKLCGEMAKKNLIDILQPFSYYAIQGVKGTEPLAAEHFYWSRLALAQMLAGALKQELPGRMYREITQVIAREQAVTSSFHFPPYGELTLKSEAHNVTDTVIDPKSDQPAGTLARQSLTPGGRLLVRFDPSLFPKNIHITKASLNLSALASEKSPATEASLKVTAYRLTSAWEEEKATWKLRNSGVPWTTSGGDYLPKALDSQTLKGAGNGKYTWDVTAAVQAWVEQGQENHGLVFIAEEGEGHKTISGSEYRGASNWQGHRNRPQLQILYELVQE